jgi:cytochrome c biogenesis protein CcmG/thiol:disulfide interchange protein DsbE
MNETGPARSAAGRAVRLVARHKVISSVTVVFAAAVIAVSLATTGSGASTGSAASTGKGASDPAAHAFSLAALGKAGQKVSLSQYPGQPVIVNFWASWCQPCQKETPLLASWYKQRNGRAVLLGLDENDTAASALKFAAAKGVSYPIGFDPDVTAALAYGVNALPQTFFLNAEHRIVYHVPGAITPAELAKGVRLMDSAA